MGLFKKVNKEVFNEDYFVFGEAVSVKYQNKKGEVTELYHALVSNVNDENISLVKMERELGGAIITKKDVILGIEDVKSANNECGYIIQPLSYV